MHGLGKRHALDFDEEVYGVAGRVVILADPVVVLDDDPAWPGGYAATRLY